MSEPKPIIYLDREHDISCFASDDETRIAMCGIHYNAEQKCLEATNARIAVWLPVIQVMGGKADVPPADCTIPTAPFQAAMSALPKDVPLKELDRVRLTTETVEDKLLAQLTPIDLKLPPTLSSKVMREQFPAFDKMMPKGEPAYRVMLNAEYLGQLADYARKVSDGGAGITFEFFGEPEDIKPCRFTLETDGGKTVTGLLMPMRL